MATTGLLGDLGLDADRLIPLVVLLCFSAFMLLANLMQQRGRAAGLRFIPGFAAARRLVDGAAESGVPVHFSLGTGLLGGRQTGDSLAGLLALNSVAAHATAARARLVVTTPDPVAQAAGQNIARNAGLAGRAATAQRDDDTVRFLAPEPLAYAAGVMGLLNREKPSGNLMLGALGDEYLLMGQTAVGLGVPQVAGATTPEALPFIVATTPDPIVGEEVFASGAYLSEAPIYRASLLAQDWLRELIMAIIVGLVLLQTLRPG